MSQLFYLFFAIVMTVSTGVRAEAKDETKLGPPPSAAEKRPENNSEITIPVFFMTDRNVSLEKSGQIKFGTERQYKGICKHDPHMGVATCTVDNNKNKSLDATGATLGWKKIGTPKPPEHALNVILDNDYTARENMFYEMLAKQAMTTQDKELFVFIPGYMSTLDSGLRSAARFAYYSERPVLLYSWPSAGEFKEYTTDEAGVEWSQDHFDRLVERLTELNKMSDGKLKVRIIAHSMGTRLVLRAVPLLKANPAFSEVSLVCPDIDDGLFQHYVSKYSTHDGKATVRLYLSHKDKMLRLSKAVHGGYERLGQTSLDDNEQDFRPDRDATVVVEDDLRKVPHRFQTIDFTEIDQGNVGHRVPVELVCSLSQTGRPNSENVMFARDYTKNKGTKNAAKPDDEPQPAEIAGLNCDYLWIRPAVASKHPLLSTVKEKTPSMRLLRRKDWTIK